MHLTLALQCSWGSCPATCWRRCSGMGCKLQCVVAGGCINVTTDPLYPPTHPYQHYGFLIIGFKDMGAPASPCSLSSATRGRVLTDPHKLFHCDVVVHVTCRVGIEVPLKHASQ